MDDTIGVIGAAMTIMDTTYPTIPAVDYTVPLETPEEKEVRKAQEEKAVQSPEEAAYYNLLHKKEQERMRAVETQRVWHGLVLFEIDSYFLLNHF